MISALFKGKHKNINCYLKKPELSLVFKKQSKQANLNAYHNIKIFMESTSVILFSGLLGSGPLVMNPDVSVSYTHLDVYKRQS